MYELQNGNLDANTIYSIGEDVEPDIFHHMHDYAYSPELAVGFLLTDKHGNSMDLYTQREQVFANFRAGNIGDKTLDFLPRYYNEYRVRTQAISLTDIDIAERWTNAKFIEVFYTNKPSAQVQKRINGLIAGAGGNVKIVFAQKN